MTTPMTGMTRSSLRDSLDLVEIKVGLKFSRAVLQEILPDVETVLFFGKVYELDAKQLSNLLVQVVNTPLAQALTQGNHSTELQTYLVDIMAQGGFSSNAATFKKTPPKGEILPELWKSLEVEVAQSIKDVAKKLEHVVGLMPGKQGSMLFSSMMKLNVKRPTIGDYRAKIHHAPAKPNLVILDVSGSMTEGTIRTIVDDVVALSYAANAHMAIVSFTTTVWEPGGYNSDDILAKAEFGGTHYETLAPLFDKDWGVVVSVADYDSARDAQHVIAARPGRIDQVVDVSLVNKPTFLAECIGVIAGNVRPVLIAQDNLTGSRPRW